MSEESALIEVPCTRMPSVPGGVDPCNMQLHLEVTRGSQWCVEDKNTMMRI